MLRMLVAFMDGYAKAVDVFEEVGLRAHGHAFYGGVTDAFQADVEFLFADADADIDFAHARGVSVIKGICNS